MMSKLNLRNQIIVGLVGAISGSMILGLPALAQTTNPMTQQANSETANPAAVNPSTEQLSSDRNVSPQQPQNSNGMVRYNGNGLLYPNDPSLSPDSNNPGLNQSPANRLTPDTIYRPY